MKESYMKNLNFSSKIKKGEFLMSTREYYRLLAIMETLNYRGIFCLTEWIAECKMLEKQYYSSIGY